MQYKTGLGVWGLIAEKRPNGVFPIEFIFGISIDPRFRYFSHSLARNSSLKVCLKTIIDIPLLTEMSQVCDSMYMGFVYKAAILLSFFSFLRISNLVPHSITAFQPVKHLTRGDIFFSAPGAHIFLKWSKTLQMNNSVRLLKIPHLGLSPICPVKALKTVLSLTPIGPNKPLFQVKFKHDWVPLSDTRLRKQFATILARINCTSQPSHSTHFDVQVPPGPSMLRFLCRIYRAMAPGRRSVCGHTLLRTIKLQML